MRLFQRVQVPNMKASGSKNHTLNVFSTRDLKFWVLGPSGARYSEQHNQHAVRGRALMAKRLHPSQWRYGDVGAVMIVKV